MRKRPLYILLAAAAVIMCALAVFFWQSPPEADPDPAPAPLTSLRPIEAPSQKSREEKENDAIQKYNDLLKAWAWDERYVSDTDADFPDFYAGGYLAGGDLVIMVTSLEDEVIDYFAQMIDLEDVLFKKAEYSFKRVKAELDAINKRWIEGREAGDPLISSIYSTGLDMEGNAVNLYITSTYNDKEAEQAFGEKVRDAVTDFPNVTLHYGSGNTLL